MSFLPENPALVFYVIVLLVVVGSFFFGDFRNRLSRALQHLAIWALIITSATVLFAYRDTIEARLFPSTAVVEAGDTILLRRARDGHFYATLAINGAPIRFIVDTGASQVVLSQQDAIRVGLDPANLVYRGRAYTANGVVRTAQVRLRDVRFGNRIDSNLRASVNQGELETSLLGMAYLSKFARIEIAGKEMRLVP